MTPASERRPCCRLDLRGAVQLCMSQPRYESWAPCMWALLLPGSWKREAGRARLRRVGLQLPSCPSRLQPAKVLRAVHAGLRRAAQPGGGRRGCCCCRWGGVPAYASMTPAQLLAFTCVLWPGHACLCLVGMHLLSSAYLQASRCALLLCRAPCSLGGSATCSPAALCPSRRRISARRRPRGAATPSCMIWCSTPATLCPASTCCARVRPPATGTAFVCARARAGAATQG